MIYRLFSALARRLRVTVCGHRATVPVGFRLLAGQIAPAVQCIRCEAELAAKDDGTQLTVIDWRTATERREAVS
jgi:hypothetical protein